MDQFVLEPLFAAGATCDVIVCKIRGTVSDADWKTLRKNKSILATNYTLTYQIEELPNVRDNRMKFNSHTNSTDAFFEDHTPKYLDGNRGVHGRFHILIFQKNVIGQTLRFNDFCYKRRPWYGPFFCCCDAKKQAIYVRTDTCEVPFRRISSKTKLEVIYEQAYKELTLTEKDAYFKVDAVRRKIDVQITDLNFLIETFKNYISNYEDGYPITESTTRDIKKYIAQAMYTYKENDCVNSQSDKKDSHNQRIVGSGQALIDRKTELYFAVKKYMAKIMHHNKWNFPHKPDLPWTPHRPFRGSIKHMECELPHLQSELHGLGMNWTLGDADCTMIDNVDRTEYEDRAREGTLSADERQRYHEHFGYDPSQRPQGKGKRGGGHGQTTDEHGRTVRLGRNGKKYVQGGAHGPSYGNTIGHWSDHDSGDDGNDGNGEDDGDGEYGGSDEDQGGRGRGKGKGDRYGSDDEGPEREDRSVSPNNWSESDSD
jgi:hypothetical protein